MKPKPTYSPGIVLAARHAARLGDRQAKLYFEPNAFLVYSAGSARPDVGGMFNLLELMKGANVGQMDKLGNDDARPECSDDICPRLQVNPLNVSSQCLFFKGRTSSSNMGGDMRAIACVIACS